MESERKSSCTCDKKPPPHCPVCGVLTVFQELKETVAVLKHLDERVAKLEAQSMILGPR